MRKTFCCSKKLSHKLVVRKVVQWKYKSVDIATLNTEDEYSSEQ